MRLIVTILWRYIALPIGLCPPPPQDGIVHPTDTSLRDFSAVCVKEFLTWSIKQTTKKVVENSLKSIFRKTVLKLYGLLHVL